MTAQKKITFRMSGKQQSETVCRSQQHIPVTSHQSAAAADFYKEHIDLETRSRGREDEVQEDKEEDERGKTLKFCEQRFKLPNFLKL